jgi:hypothetical protein
MSTIRVSIGGGSDEEPRDDTKAADSMKAEVTVLNKSFSGHATGHRVEFSTSEPVVDYSTLTPFASVEEMTAAEHALTREGARRIFVDEQYRAEIEARIGLSMGYSGGANPVPEFVGTHDQMQATQSQPQSLLIQTEQPSGDVFEDMDAVVAAMSNKRYRIDAAYRRAVDAKLARSNV